MAKRRGSRSRSARRARWRRCAALFALVCGLAAPVGCTRRDPAAAFDPSSSELRFRRYLQDHAVRVDHMTPAAGANAFLDFYDATTFAVIPGGEGDALRIEWQAASSGEGGGRLTLARDFIWPATTAKEPLARWSLWMTFHAPGSDSTSAPASGRRRWAGEEARDACAAFLRDLPLYGYLAERPDDRVEIGFDPTPP
jgi:hypothetical protein